MWHGSEQENGSNFVSKVGQNLGSLSSIKIKNQAEIT